MRPEHIARHRAEPEQRLHRQRDRSKLGRLRSDEHADGGGEYPEGAGEPDAELPDNDLPFSGLLGTVNQDSRDVSTADATQTETQCEDAATGGLSVCKTAHGRMTSTDVLAPTRRSTPQDLQSTKAGQGPVHYVHKGVGQATQTGNTGDTFTINQSSTQDDDTGSRQTNTSRATAARTATARSTRTSTSTVRSTSSVSAARLSTPRRPAPAAICSNPDSD